MQPLKGLTVVTLEHAIAAPFATRQLADLGARVIKIERPGVGDFARSYDTRARGLASHFVWTNRSKESLTLDVKHAEAEKIFDALLTEAIARWKRDDLGAAFDAVGVPAGPINHVDEVFADPLRRHAGGQHRAHALGSLRGSPLFGSARAQGCGGLDDPGGGHAGAQHGDAHLGVGQLVAQGHGDAKGGTALNFGSYGLKAMEPERITARQIEAARRAITLRADSGIGGRLCTGTRISPA